MKTILSNFKHKQFCITIFAVLLALIFLVTPIVNASSSKPKRTMHVKSIEIKGGDTLWSIAKEHYTEEYESVQQYIDEIKKTNRLSYDEIHAGNYLIVPYYS